MKKVITSLLCIILALFNLPFTAFAIGSGNIDGGGGGMGNGTNQNYWNNGDDGVRITVIRNRDRVPVTTSIDFTNRNESNIQVHFGKKSKISYANGSDIIPSTSSYRYYNPSQPIPKIISNNGNVNIDAIKRYFCSEYALKLIGNATGMNYNTLINGEYKILLEPIAYMTFQGIKMAMTAHEAAMYDEKLGGGLRSKMVSLSNKNLPLSMFLQTSDLGFAAWNGSTNNKVSDEQIKQYLGLGIVRFADADKGVQISTNSYEYRTDTDVITSITVTTDKRHTQDNPVSVTFKVDGKSYTVNDIYIPEGESQLIWFKWHTPKTPQTMNINVSVSGAASDESNITAKIIELNENTPPNPTANDKNDNFKASSIPNNPQNTTATWGEWDSYWQPQWEWEADWNWIDEKWVDNGKWVDKGDWNFRWISYSASLSASLNVQPDSKVPTTSNKTMKSGYGINVNASTSLSSNASSLAVTGAQNVISYYPEFNYQNYNRVLEKTSGDYVGSFQLKNNKYSTYSSRTHFTPVWFPDGAYTVYAEVIDAWTPVGMLSSNLNNSVNIKGSLYDDWHIGPRK